MSRATEDLLDGLHGITAQTYADEIQRYKDGLMKDADGNPLPIPVALLTSAAKFLKDNGIEAIPTNNSTLVQLLEEMPFDEDDLIQTN